MLPRAVERTIDAIAADVRSGALPLALRALEAHASLAQASPDADALRALHDRLRKAQPWMAAVVNASSLGMRLVEAGLGESIPSLAARLQEAQRKVAEAAQDAWGEVRTLLTVSHSSDVLEALARLPQAATLQVYVCESRPLREGEALAGALRDRGIRSILVADAAGPGLVGQCDAVVTGADALLRRDGLVNKIGTLSLALACEASGVSFLPLLEVLKVELEEEPLPRSSEDRDPAELSKKVEAWNFYFEIVPESLLGRLITDAGVMEPGELRESFATPEHLMAFYLRTP